MAYRDDIEEDLKRALRERNTTRVSLLRMLLSAVSYREIEKKSGLSEDEFHGVVRSMIKQHTESIESFRKGRRADLVEKEEKELLILKEFVPAQLAGDEIAAEMEAAIAALGVRDQKDMGKVMKFLMEKLSSRVDGKVLSEMVRNRLSSQRPS